VCRWTCRALYFQADEKRAPSAMKTFRKKEILAMARFVKLDAVEAQTLTGVDSLEDQADMLEAWGSSETILTSSEGCWLGARGKPYFRNLRTGAAEAGWGAATPLWDPIWRAGWIIPLKTRFGSPQPSQSIKMESAGPFRGSLKDVIERMNGPIQGMPSCT